MTNSKFGSQQRMSRRGVLAVSVGAILGGLLGFIVGGWGEVLSATFLGALGVFIGVVLFETKFSFRRRVTRRHVLVVAVGAILGGLLGFTAVGWGAVMLAAAPSGALGGLIGLMLLEAGKSQSVGCENSGTCSK